MAEPFQLAEKSRNRRVSSLWSIDLSGLFALTDKIPLWTVLASIAAILRIPTLSSESFWYDETFTAWLSKLPTLDRLMTAIRGDVHPPLWYLIESGLGHIYGYSEFILRLPAAIFGVLSVLLVWQIAKQLQRSELCAFVAGILAAVLPGILYYGQEARMYTLLEFGVLVAVYEGLKFKWGGYVVGCVIAMYSQNLGVVYVGLLSVVMVYYVLIDLWRDSWGDYFKRTGLRVWPRVLFSLARSKTFHHGWWLFGPLLAIVIPWLVWLPWFFWGVLYQAHIMGGGFWLLKPDPGSLATPLVWMTIGERLPITLITPAYWLAWSATILGIVASWRWLKMPRGIIILALIAGVPLALAVVSELWRSVYLYRAMIPSAALLCVPWAYLLTETKPGNRAIAALALIPTLIISLVYFYVPTYGRVDIRAKLAPVAASFRPGDILYYTNIDSAIEYSYFLPNLPYALMPGAGDYNQQLQEPALSAFGLHEAAFADLCKEGYTRAWLMVAQNPLTGSTEYQYDNMLLSKPHTLFADYVSPEQKSMPIRIEADLVGTCEVNF